MLVMVNWSSPAVKRQLPSGWVVSMVPVTRSTFTWPSRSSRSSRCWEERVNVSLLFRQAVTLWAVRRAAGVTEEALWLESPSSKRTAPTRRMTTTRLLGRLFFRYFLDSLASKALTSGLSIAARRSSGIPEVSWFWTDCLDSMGLHLLTGCFS